jgi:hypothetical protein
VRKRPTFYNEVNPECDIEACFDILRGSDFGFVHQVLTFTREHAEAESTFNKRLGVSYLGNLELLTKYGPTYLSDEEYKQCIRQYWGKYYRFLGYSMVYGNKEKGFWQFQKNVLGRMGYSLSMGRVARAIMAELLDLTLNPLRTSIRIARKLSRLLGHTTR